MEDFTISNHPILTGVTRKVQVLKMDLDVSSKELTFYFLVKHYVDGILIPEYNKQIRSVADNGTQYPTGQVDADGNPILIGEYDYWDYLYSQNYPLSAMLQTGINNMILHGTLDAKCAYQSVVEP